MTLWEWLRALAPTRVGELEVAGMRHVFTSTALGMSIWVNGRQEADLCYARELLDLAAGSVSDPWRTGLSRLLRS